MRTIYLLLHSLSSSEWSSFEKYLSCFTASNPSELKQLALARTLIHAKKEPTSRQCCLELYGTGKNPGFNMLKSRLKEKLLDFLLSDVGADKKNILDEIDYTNIKLKKRSAQYQLLLYSRNRIEYIYEIVDEIIEAAKTYEHFSCVVEHLRIKKERSLLKNGRDDHYHLHIKKEMEKYSMYYQMTLKAEDYYQHLMALGNFHSKPNNKAVSNLLKKAIPELKKYYKITGSNHINYWLHMMYLGYHHNRSDFTRARSTCLDLLHLVRTRKPLYRRERISIMYDHLSHYECNLGLYKQAAENAREAQKNFYPYTLNLCTALTMEFYPVFMMKQYNKAREIADKILANASEAEVGVFRYSKFKFLLASALFKQGEFQETFHLLSRRMNFSEDKSGWEVGLRILRIMSLVELGRSKEAGSAVLALKQYFKTFPKKNSIGERDKKILNLLLIAERNGFDFTSLKSIVYKYLKALTGSDNKALRWKPFTHEVIPFHEWFAGKMKKSNSNEIMEPSFVSNRIK